MSATTMPNYQHSKWVVSSGPSARRTQFHTCYKPSVTFAIPENVVCFRLTNSTENGGWELTRLGGVFAIYRYPTRQALRLRGAATEGEGPTHQPNT